MVRLTVHATLTTKWLTVALLTIVVLAWVLFIVSLVGWGVLWERMKITWFMYEP